MSNLYRDGRVHVKQRMCDTCIFRPGNVMRLRRGRVAGMVRLAKLRETAITCHETLGAAEAVCYGFFEKHATAPLQIAERLGMIEWQ